MPRDKTANHIKIMAAAKAEFMEFGFEKSSMRSIADRCGMTAAGIYRHCMDKEDLFDQIVSPAVERINAWIDAHVARYVDAVNQEEPMQWRDSEIDMENFLHDLTERHQNQLLRYMPMLRNQGYPAWDIDPKELHLLLSAYTTAMFEPVVHLYTMEEALHSLKTVEAFFLPGWKQLMGF